MNRVYIIAVIVLLTACSTPKKYTYFFDSQTTKPKEAPVVVARVTAENAPSRDVAPALASAGDSKEAVVLTPVQANASQETKVDLKTSTKTKREFKKEVKQQLKKLIKENKAAPERAADTKVNNPGGFAIAGFVLSLLGLLLFWPLCILGIIFSAIGLQSDKKGLAIAGLVIGIVGIVLVLIGVALIAAWS